MDPPPPSPFFINGQVVEVTSQEPGFEGSWFIAMIIRKSAKKSNKFIVEYENLIDEQGLKPLKEYVHLKNIRPLQPQQPPRLFQEKEEVDAFHNDGWWKGVVAEVLENSCYLVEFQCSDEALVFKQSDLRVHLEWINGKWVNLAQQDQEVTVGELNEGNGNFPNPTASPSCSTVMDAQLTPSVVIEKSLGKVTSSSMNDAGRVDYDTTIGEADSPCDPLFSIPKDTEQSIPRGNNDGPPKKVGGQMSIRACSERGISTGSCNDVEADFMFSSPSPKGRRSKIEIRRARNSFSSELFFNSSGSPTGSNHVSLEIGEEKPKDDLESKSSEIKVSPACSHLNSDIMEVEPSVVLSSPQSNTQCLEEQKVVLPTKQMKETSTPLQEEDRVNTQSGITVKRKRGRPKGSGKKQKKANTSGSQNFRIISPLQGVRVDFAQKFLQARCHMLQFTYVMATTVADNVEVRRSYDPFINDSN